MAEELKKDGTPKKKPGRKPKGLDRPSKEEIERSVETSTAIEGVHLKGTEGERKGTAVELPIDDIRQISVTSRRRVSMAKPEFDPFNKYKTDEKRFHYRALNKRPHLLNKREAEGYQTIPGSEYGDLILGKIPKEDYKERVAYKEERTKRQTKAAVEQFKAEAERAGMKPYEERDS
ncbi:MAG TPA: hypothetical protein VIY48_21350 [Candidatus Paceibacterota bacterium]